VSTTCAPARPHGPGVFDRLRRWLLDPEYPLVALEVRARSLGAVRLTRARGGFALGAAASLSLPEGALGLSMVQGNILDPGAFREALKGVLERAGIPLSGTIGLVLPDPVARVYIAEAAEFLGKRSEEVEELLRFKLRKAVLFEMKDARLSIQMPEPQAPEGVVIAVAIANNVLEGYEQALSDLGLRPGLVELAGLAMLDTAKTRGGDCLVVNWDDGYVSLLLTRRGRAALVRTLSGEAASTEDDIVRLVANTVLYYGERLGGTELERVFVRSTVIPAASAVELLREPAGMTPEILNPWVSVQGTDAGAGAETQTVAGAAACVAGKL
jgi:hypothetical protein